MSELKVLGISGSLRSDSSNRKLLRLALQYAAREGAVVHDVDLRVLNLPIYDEDLQEEGIPESVLLFKKAVRGSDVVLIASPEYNYSVPGGLKNALDWASRSGNAFDGKVAAIFGASGGLSGTIRMQPHLRMILASMNVLVLPQPQVLVRHGREAFAADGSLLDEKVASQLQTLVMKTIAMTRILKSADILEPKLT